jgi:hypothetical protein
MSLEVQIGRFPGRFRERVRYFATTSNNLGQLAFTFPVLLHALATDYGPREVRLAAIELAELGRPLAEIALTIGLPLCLRRLPPEACCEPFAWAQCSRGFNRILANHVPRSPGVMPAWLSTVFYAAHTCDETFAGWIARQHVLHDGTRLDARVLFPLALLAWHSQREDVALRRLAFTPWTPRISYKLAVLEAKHWFNRVKLLVYLADQPIADTWLDGGSACGFEFLPVTTADHVINERIAMDNCVDGYAEKLAYHHCRLFSVRRRGERIALLEITPGQDDPSIPRKGQLKGPRNIEVSEEAHHAAGVWLHRQGHRRILAGRQPSQQDAALKLRQLLAPYWAAMARRGTLDRVAPLMALSHLDACLVQLAQVGGLSGWPFARRVWVPVSRAATAV